MNLEVKVTGGEGRVVVSVKGEVDVSNADALRVKIDEALADEQAGQVEVDMAEVPYIDSTGIGVLVGSAHRAKDCGKGFSVLGAQPNVLRIFGLLGVDEVLEAR